MLDNQDFDAVIVGSGPAGVSAAFPLLEAGARVLMVDGGRRESWQPPAEQYLSLRRNDPDQWHWFVGKNFHALRHNQAASPKLRVTTHESIFEGFQAANRIVTDDFVAIGSLAAGGLSNAWGCGVASLSDSELASFPVDAATMRTSYASVAKRIGISGRCPDDMEDFFGVDAWAQPPLPMDDLHSSIHRRYLARRDKLLQNRFRLGQARIAVLSEPLGDRMACDQSGTCLWGCGRQALYSAAYDLRSLKARKGFHYRPGHIVDGVYDKGGSVIVEGEGPQGPFRFTARRALLAAGTLASTRLALQAIDYRLPLPLQSCPTAAFLLCLPQYLGRPHQAVTGLGQLSFALTLANETQSFGSLFSTTGIPVTEFARHLPFGKRYAVDFLRKLLPACTVGNIFLPGSLTAATVQLSDDRNLMVNGSYKAQTTELMREARARLANSFRHVGAILIPGSFTVGRPGTDIHYSATLPMCETPQQGQTGPFGELAGASRIYVIDGASLPYLPAKSHTFTIMANADRIARHISTTSMGAEI